MMINISRYVFFLFILAGCGAGYRARLLLDDAERDIEKAETAEVKDHILRESSEAKSMILYSRRLLETAQKRDALSAAIKARDLASEALLLSRKSEADLSIKEARESLALVDENNAFRENESLYQLMLSDIQKGEKAFIADRFESSVVFSKSAVKRAEILLNPLKKEAELARGRVMSAWMDSGKGAMRSKEIEALIGEGEGAFQSRRYFGAALIWDKAEKEMRSPGK
ncbi:hypothetical protein JW926_04440 [Candidatus Sumerlaeota bacterium]|nr:hypothetical protein [Candidatus Sumerlaeota bacterium]